MGNRAALFRAAAERNDFGEGKLSNGPADRFQFPLGERTVDLSLLQTARFNEDACGVGRDVADHTVSDSSRNGAGSAGAGQRYSQEVSEELRVFGLHAIQQLFHDHDLPDAVALPGIQLDMGPPDRDCVVCAAGLASAAFWAQAVEEVSRFKLKVTVCKLAGITRRVWQDTANAET